MPTAPAPIPTLPIIEPYVELGYANQTEINEPFPVRLTLKYVLAGAQFAPAAEPFESAAILVPVQSVGDPGPLTEARGPGYETFVVARLEGAGAEIAPVDGVEYRLIDQQEVTWSWTVITDDPGRLLLDATVDIEWRPIAGGQPIRYQLAHQRIAVQVDSPFFVLGDPLSLTSLLSFVFGAIITAITSWLWGRFIGPGEPPGEDQPSWKPRERERK